MSAQNLDKSEGIPSQNWFLLQQFNFYRLAVAFFASILALLPLESSPFGEHAPNSFAISALAYLVIAALAIAATNNRRIDFYHLVQGLAVIDIIIITILMHTSGGLASGIGLLLLVTIAENGVLLERTRTFALAAIATFSVMIEYAWTGLSQSQFSGAGFVHGLPKIGLMGFGLFLTAAVVNGLASRLRQTTALVKSQEVSLGNVEIINDLIIQNMQSGVVVCDNYGRIRALNDAAQTFLGLKQQNWQDQPLETQAPELATQLVDWVSHPVERTRKLLKTTVGFTLMPRFIFVGNERNYSGIVIFLEDTEVLRQQAQQLKMAALARLAASIAHEVRNPLSAISNAAQLLRETTDKEDKESRRLLEIIMDHGKRVNEIVENITQLSRRDRTSRERTPLVSWAHDFVAQYSQGADTPEEAIEIVGDMDDLEVCVDPSQIYQVVTNLCQNAIRHSDPYTGQKLIRLQVGQDMNDRPYLEVVDWGKGIPPEIAQNIFDPFFTTTSQGTGLGLYISRELCEGNGALLQLMPAPEKGSRFRITFARAEECSET
jgi:two-component system sensor histidine kinase PilS (NtrC family)